MNRLLCVLLVCTSLISVAVKADTPIDSQAPIKVITTIPPQKYLIKRIAAEHVMPVSLVSPGVELETYEPTPRQLEQLLNADIFFPIGFPAEQHWLKLTQASKITVHACCEQHLLQSRLINDPHLWNDPLIILKLIDEFTEVLSAHRSELATVFQSNAAELKRELNTLHISIQHCFQNKTMRTFLVDHGSWDYFAQRYDLIQLALEYEGREQGPKALRNTIRKAQEAGINTLFLQQQSASGMSRLVMKELNASAQVLEPLGENYIDNIRNTAHKILVSLGDAECQL